MDKKLEQTSKIDHQTVDFDKEVIFLTSYASKKDIKLPVEPIGFQ